MTKQCLFTILAAVLALSVSLPMHAQQDSTRKRVAIVLSGGGAKGVAHVGVLKVVERAGIPVDIITGTSMGSIIGGLYCCGWDATALDTMIRRQNWAFLLGDREDYYSQNLEKREKLNTYALSKTIPIRRRSVSEAGGIIQGRNLEKLFMRLTAGYTDSMDFSNLPIPFACVATNIIDNTEYDFHSGVLAKAMRTSMAIPAVFSPVRMGDMVLVDGGLRNNYPADIARDMGADYIIGATVQGTPLTAKDITNTASVLGQIVDVNCKNKYDENLAITDIPIRVNTDGYSAASFTATAIDTLIRRGEQAAMEHWDELLALKRRLGLPDDYRPRPRHPNPEALVPVDFAVEDPYARPKQDIVQGRLGVRFDSEERVAVQVNAVYMSSRKPLDVEVTTRVGENIMASLGAVWKPHNFARLGVNYTFRNSDINIYEQGKPSHSFKLNRHQVQLGIMGISVKNLDMDIAMRWDHYAYYRVMVTSRLGHEGFSLSPNAYISYHARLHYNSEDDWNFPTRGARFKAGYAYFTDNFVGYADHTGFSELDAAWRMSFRLSTRLTFQPMLYGRMLFGADIPNVRRNLIGGQWFAHYIEQQMPFVGLRRMELVKNRFVGCQLKLQERLFTNHFVLFKVVAAQHADKLRHLFDTSTLWGGQLAYYYRTMFGPIGAALGYSNKSDKVDFFVNVGYEF